MSFWSGPTQLSGEVPGPTCKVLAKAMSAVRKAV